MKILKRNQLIILVVSLMLITAGYLNFTANQENIQTSTIADRSDTAIGDAELVSTILQDETVNAVSEASNTEITTDENTSTENETIESSTEVQEESVENSDEESEDYYFTTSKLERNTMYSELLETYQDMYNDSNASAEAKTEALNQINNINNTKNAIMISENLLLAKGFEDAVIFVNEGSVSVIIKSEELKQEEVAQIQNIISRELNDEIENIHIYTK